MLLPVLVRVAAVHSRGGHQCFFTLEMVLGVFGQFLEYRFNILIRQFVLFQKFAELVDDIHAMGDLLADWCNGSYRRIPWWTVAAIAFAVLYIVNPFDIIPDHLLIFGELDDYCVAVLCLSMVSQDLKLHRQWKRKQEQKQKEESGDKKTN